MSPRFSEITVEACCPGIADPSGCRFVWSDEQKHANNLHEAFAETTKTEATTEAKGERKVKEKEF